MPRKQNGFGNSKSFAAKGVNSRVDVGKVKGAGGTYPSNRRFGSSVHRTVIEQYDLNSDWVKWRKGLEFYYQAAWYRLTQKNPDYNPFDEASEEYVDLQIDSKLYQGTEGEIAVRFDGYRFATKNSDTGNHYVIKRTPIDPVSLGNITQVFNDPTESADNYKNKEIWAYATPNTNSTMLRHMVGERITDGETEATLSYVLTQQEHPSIFIGKASPLDRTVVKVTVPKADIAATQFIQDNNGDFNALIGELGYVKDFVRQLPITQGTYSFQDQANFLDVLNRYFTVETDLSFTNAEFEILDQNQSLPPTLLDIDGLPKIFSTTSADFTAEGTFFYDKNLYQRFYGKSYLTADVVRSEVTHTSFTIFPFAILSVKEIGNNIEITSVPFSGELNLFAPLGDRSTLVFADNSFTKTAVDLDASGNYYHADLRDETGAPLEQWQIIDTDVKPWETNVFTSGGDLTPAVVYACSCPNHSHAQLRMPEATDDAGRRKINRQRQYPLPSAVSVDRFTEGALPEVAGAAVSWATRDYRMSYKQCKHSIAARFIERIKTKEPDSYPSISSRLRFEEKLENEINDVGEEFNLSYERSGISLLEIIFAMAQALNMDDAELAYVIFNSKY